jgi:iron complex outermembrane receptor protein
MAARLKNPSFRSWSLIAGSVGALLISSVALAQEPAPAEPEPAPAEGEAPPAEAAPAPAPAEPGTAPLDEPPAPTGAIEGEVVAEPGAPGDAAAGASDGEVGEVVVTVDRREKNVQKYAGTAAAFSEEQLSRVGIQNVRDLGSSVPGVVIGVQEGSAEIFIRGVGSNNNTELGDPAVALHLDGVYIPRPRGAGAMFFDIERVEVNSGPQGTLYGRNAVGGNVNIVSKRPKLGEFEAYGEATFGTYSTRIYNGAVNIPIGDKLAVRAAAWSEVHDPYWENAGPIWHLPGAESADSYAFRGQVKWEPTKEFSALVALDYIRERGTGWLGANFQGPLTREDDQDTPDRADDVAEPYDINDIDNPRRVYQRGMSPWYDLKHWGVRGDFSYDFGPLTAQALGSFRDMRYVQRNGGNAGLVYDGYEFDNTGAPADNFGGNFWDQGSRSVVGELRLFAPETSRFRWTVGAFAFHEDQDTFLGSNSDPANGFAGTEFPMPDTKGTSIAGYADGTFDVVKEFRVVGGIRVTHEKKGRHNGLFAIYGGFPNGGRFGTEGFQFQGANGRSLFSVPSDSTVTDRVNLFLDGIKSFGARDTVPQALCADPPEGQPRIVQNATGNFRCGENGINPALLQQEADFNAGVDGVGRPFDITATPQNNDVTNTFFDWRAGVEFDAAKDNLLYATVSTGHKAAGFNDTSTVDGALFDSDYDPESLIAFELGSKNMFAERHIRLNASAFYYRYSDQVFQTVVQVSPANPDIPGSTGSSAALSQNAASSNILGLDLDFTWSLPLGLEANVHALLMNATFGDGTTVNDSRLGFDIPRYLVDISGNWLPRTTPVTLNYALSQVIFSDVGNFDWTISGQTKLKQYMTPFNGDGNLLPRVDGEPDPTSDGYLDLTRPNGAARLTDVIPGYTRFDIGGGWTHPDGRITISGYVNNVLDTTYVQSLISTPSLNLRFFNPPRTAGVRFKVLW